MRIKKLVKKFLRIKRSGDLADATKRFYLGPMRKFEKKFGHLDWKKLKPTQIDKFLRKIGNGLSGTTQHHNATALENFQNVLIEKRIIKKRRFQKLDKPPIGRRDFVPADDQHERLLEHATVKFRLIHAGLSLCGARPGELCRTQISDVDWSQGDHGVIVLQKHKTARKTGKPRLIPISARMAAVIRTSIGTRSQGPVFRTELLKAWSPTYLSSVFRALRRKAGLPEEYKLYSERHRVATRMLEEGVPIEFVKEILGHSSVTMTEKYTHIKPATLSKHLDKI